MTPIDPSAVTDPVLREQLANSMGKSEPLEVRTLDEYLELEIKQQAELVTPNAIVRGGLSATVGAGGVGKTTMLMGRLMRWAAGLPWIPEVEEAFHPVQPLKTIVIENEGSGGLFQQKLRTMRENSNFSRDEDIMLGQNLMIVGEGGYAGIRMDEPKDVDRVRRALEEHEPDILFMEPFARLWQGNENDNTEMNAILSGLEDLAGKYNCAIMLAHHRKKGEVGAGQSAQDFSRGASALEGAVTYMEFLHRSKNGWLEIDSTKNRYGDPIGPYYMDWKGNAVGWSHHVDAVQVIVDLLNEKGAQTLKQIARTGTGIGETEARTEAILEHGMRQKRIKFEDALKPPAYLPWGDDLREADKNGAAGQRF